MEPRVKRHPVEQPLDQSIKLIPLTKGKTARVDASEYERISANNWMATWNKYTRSYYARRYSKVKDGPPRRMIAMQNEVMSNGKINDHADRNTLNNVKSNLRPSTVSQNGGNCEKRKHNTSGYKGVVWNNRWRAQLLVNGKKYHAGYFDDPIDAARAYDRKAIELFGDFACTNFPRSDYD
jgi:hypothetical protein